MLYPKHLMTMPVGLNKDVSEGLCDVFSSMHGTHADLPLHMACMDADPMPGHVHGKIQTRAFIPDTMAM
jgi:hypothetical protein